jgi:uncharacterized protein YbaR (Trm112 family)
MRRAFDLDVLVCPRCGGRLRLVATIEDPVVKAELSCPENTEVRCPLFTDTRVR